MKASAKSTILKNTAKNVMAGKYYHLIMAVLFAGMISLLVNRFTYAFNRQVCLTLMNSFGLGEGSALIIALSYLIPLLFSIILNMLQVGTCLFFLSVATGNPFFSFQLLYGYFHDFGKYFRLSGILTLLSFVCLLPLNVALDLYQSAAFLQSPLFYSLAGLQLVLLVIYVCLSLSLSQTLYLTLDYPDMSITDALKTSMKIMKGKKRQLFYVQLSFLPLYLIAILTFGLGLFWILPYRGVTYALYYLDLMKPADPTYQS